MNILIDENIVLLEDAVKHLGKTMLVNGRNLDKDFLIKNGSDVVFARSQTKVNFQLLDGTKVKFISTSTSGTDHFDLEYLNSSDIYYASAKGCNANSVAEYVVYAILKWSILNNINLENQSIGIIGFGSIGKLVAKYSQFLGLKVIINDPPLKNDNHNFPDEYSYMELDELISNSNIITNHVPLTKSGNYPTYNLLNGYNLQNVKANSLIIHSSRGSIVDESALIELHKSKNVTLVVDVWNNEPSVNMELVDCTILATPHIAGYSFNGKIIGSKMVLDHFENHFNLKTNMSLIESALQYYSPLKEIEYKDKFKLFEKLSDSRNFEYDNNLFRSLKNFANEEIRIKFDLQRKNYPLRKEIL